MTEKTKLAGGPDKTVTWIWIENGRFKVEYYDFSESAQSMFGNDLAWTITVDDMNQLCSTLDKDTSLIGWMEQRLESYFGVRQWLEENGIDFSPERESWA